MKYEDIKTNKKISLQMPELKINSTNKPAPTNINLSSDVNSEMLDLVEINSKEVLKGIIWSQILEKPKSLRKGR